MPAGRDTSRSLHAHFGFDPQHVLLVSTDLYLAGYTADQVPPMQKRMLDAVSAIPGVESVGLSDPLLLNDTQSTDVFSEQTTDLRPANAAANVYMFHVSPDYLRAEGTTLLGGRDFTWHDNKNAPRVAVVNREFARKIFGSAENAIGGYFKNARRNSCASGGYRGKREVQQSDRKPHMGRSSFPFCNHRLPPTTWWCVRRGTPGSWARS